MSRCVWKNKEICCNHAWINDKETKQHFRSEYIIIFVCTVCLFITLNKIINATYFHSRQGKMANDKDYVQTVNAKFPRFRARSS